MSHKFTQIILILLTLGTQALAQFDANHPELDWRVIETEHFKVYYHQGLGKLAPRAAQAAEDAYGPIASFYNFEPDSKVRIILKDTEDYANGAAYYYHNTIEIWVSNLDFALRGSTDWLPNVITHELTHIISLQIARKSSRRISAIFVNYLQYQGEGKRDDILAGYPNVLAAYAIPATIIPPWFAEGTAQYMAPGAQHDHWDSHRDMVLRQATRNGSLLTRGEMSVFGAKTGLGFEKVYDHGYSLSLFIADTFGRDKLPELYQQMKVWWRTDFGGAIRATLGISASELHTRWVASLKKRYAAQIEQIETNPAQGDLICEDGYLNLHPRWSPDGTKLAYLSNKGRDYGRTSLMVYTLADSSEEIAAPSAVTAFDWSTDGEQFLYARHSQPNKYGGRQWDLYTMDPKAPKSGLFQNVKTAIGLVRSTFPGETRLSTGARGIHPAYSPDGTQIAFVKNGGGSTNLCILDIAADTIRYLTSFDDGSQVATPRWSPDGSQIAFSFYRSGTSRDIATIPATGGTYTVRVASRETDRDPCWTPDGSSLVFASDHDGIFNLYRANLSNDTIDRLTRVYGGAFQPHVHPDGHRIAYAHYGKNAYEIRVISQPLNEPVEANIFRVEPFAPATSKPAIASRPYKNEFSTTTILPRLAIDSGKLKFGVIAGSDDVLRKQTFFISGLLAHDLDMDLYALYEYRKKRPTFFLEAYRLSRHVEEDVISRDEDFRIYNRTFALTGIEIGGKYTMRRGGVIDARLVYNRTGAVLDQARFNGLNRNIVGATTLNGFDLALTYRLNAIGRSRDSEINPRTGRRLALRYDRYFNWFISGFEENTSLIVETYDRYFYNQLSLDWNEFIPVAPGRSALSFRFFGGVINSEVDNAFDFFLGGLPGMKGYTFYSLEGRRALMLRSAYRFPIWSRIDRQTGPIYSDQLYGAFFAGIARAWDGTPDDAILKRGWKRELGAQLRYDATSFYLFPTRASLDVAYGFDHVPLQRAGDPLERSGLKVYFTLLFGFVTDVGKGHF